MDKETLKMFSELLDSKLGELENRLDSKLGELENRLDDKLESLENRLEGKLGTLEKRLDDKLDKNTMLLDKNTILLENLTVKVETIAEIQKSHMEQDEKAHNDMINKFNCKIDLIELAIKDTSKDVKEIKDGLMNVELITSSNWNEIIKLKAVR
jgi:hypothetical protein